MLRLQYWSKGISACAICDGASPLFKEREVAVVGGGDSAAEEAVYLTKYASRVHLLVRGPQMRASKAMADRASSHPKVQVHYNTAVEDGFGNGVLEVSQGWQSGVRGRARPLQSGEGHSTDTAQMQNLSGHCWLPLCQASLAEWLREHMQPPLQASREALHCCVALVWR